MNCNADIQYRTVLYYTAVLLYLLYMPRMDLGVVLVPYMYGICYRISGTHSTHCTGSSRERHCD
eukprot:COSAG02_NODE_332_length_24474_cov_23.190949_8_plen_64_part_00